MRIIKVGKHVLMRHWFRWYWVHQAYGGSSTENNWVARIDFTKDIE